MVAGEISLAEFPLMGFWDWFRNPVPPPGEHRDIDTLRRVLGMTDDQAIANGSVIEKLKQAREALERGW